MNKLLCIMVLSAALTHASPSHSKQASVDCGLLQRAASASRSAYNTFERNKTPSQDILATFHGTKKIGGFSVLRKGTGGWCELAFKGTDITDPEDVLLDLAAAIPAQCGGKGKGRLGICAAGFFLQYLSIRKAGDLFAKLKQQRAKGHCANGLLVTGHSLGGALASLFAADAFTKDPKQYGKARMKVVTLAEPRVFGTSTAERFHKVIDKVRVINFGDKIASVPMKRLGFKHFGKPLFLKEPLLGVKGGRLVITEPDVDFSPRHAGLFTLAYHALLAYELRLSLCRP